MKKPLDQTMDGSGTSISSLIGEVPLEDEKDVLRICKLLSDKKRFHIFLLLLSAKELHVTTLRKKMKMSQPAVSHHLYLLLVGGLIEGRREGKYNFYYVTQKTRRSIAQVLFHLGIFQNALDVELNGTSVRITDPYTPDSSECTSEKDEIEDCNGDGEELEEIDAVIPPLDERVAIVHAEIRKRFRPEHRTYWDQQSKGDLRDQICLLLDMQDTTQTINQLLSTIESDWPGTLLPN